MGVPFESTPGPLNAITDVRGVEVGYRTLILTAMDVIHDGVSLRMRAALAAPTAAIARRATLGLGRLGSISGSGSGDIFIAFSTANAGAELANRTANVEMIPSERINPLFEATVQATRKPWSML